VRRATKKKGWKGKKEQGKRRKKHTSLFSFNHNRHGLQAKRKRGTISRETFLIVANVDY